MKSQRQRMPSERQQLGDFGEPHADGACDHEGQCVLLTIWNDVGGHMRTHLQAHTLANMVLKARGLPVEPVEIAEHH